MSKENCGLSKSSLKTRVAIAKEVQLSYLAGTVDTRSKCAVLNSQYRGQCLLPCLTICLLKNPKISYFIYWMFFFLHKTKLKACVHFSSCKVLFACLFVYLEWIFP